MDHHRCGGVGEAAVAGGEVPDTAQQGARRAAHQHQGLREEEEDESGGNKVKATQG